jgi:hypothetical protein
VTAPAAPQPRIPDTVLTEAATALDTYRLITPPDQWTPHGAAAWTLAELAAAGWEIRPATEEAP